MMKDNPTSIGRPLFHIQGQLAVKIIEVSVQNFDSNQCVNESTTTTHKSKRHSISSSVTTSFTNTSKKTIQSAFIIVDVSLCNDDRSSTVCTVQTPPSFCSLLPNYGRGSCLIGEELVFDHVVSTYILCVTLLYEVELESGTMSPNKRRQGNERGIVGMIDIPITRLESDKPVTQWYQLLHPITKEGLKNAIRIEVLFSEDVRSVAPGHISDVASSSLRTSGRVKENRVTIENESEMKSAVEGIDQMSSIVTNDNNNTGYMNGSQYSLEPVNAVESKRLPTGLVDYIVIVGQQEKTILCPKYEIKRASNSNSSKEAKPSPKALKSSIQTTSSSPQSTPISPTITHATQSLVWDRFPRQDYPDNPLPDKIEWFVSPQGSETLCSPSRPKQSLSSFVLSTGDNSGQLYGTRLRYYLNAGKCSYCSALTAENALVANGRVESSNWWTYPTEQLDLQIFHNLEHDQHLSMHDSYTWISVDVAMLSRWSFIDQTSKCLEYVYENIILPDMIRYEETYVLANATNSQSKVQERPLLTLNADQIFIALCFECPAPVPGLYSVSLRILSAADQNINTLSSLNKMPDDQKEDLSLAQPKCAFQTDFQLSPVNSLPSSPYALISLLEIFGSRSLVDILCCALSESRVLFHSKDLSKLPIICECLVTLLYPFKWSHVYLPVVPAPLLDLVEAPVPFMLGTHSSWLQYLSQECLNDVVVVDCDIASIDMHDVHPFSFPEAMDRWLILCLRSLNFQLNENNLKNDTDEEYFRRELSLQLQIIVFDLLVSLLKNVPQCLFYLDRNTPIFNRPLFLSEFTTNECQNCVKILSDTNAFHRFTDALHTYRLQFFVESADRFPNSDWMEETFSPLHVLTNHDTDDSQSELSALSLYDEKSPESSISPLWQERSLIIDPSLSNMDAINPINVNKLTLSMPPTGRSFTPRGVKSTISEFHNVETASSRSQNDVISGNHNHSNRYGGIASALAMQSPMQKIFHSSFRAKNIDEVIAASTNMATYDNTSDAGKSTSSGQGLTKTFSRRLSFTKQKSWNGNISSRQGSINRGSSDKGVIENDLDSIFLELDSNRSRTDINEDDADRVQKPSDENVKDITHTITDKSIPSWIYYGAHLHEESSSSTNIQDEKNDNKVSNISLIDLSILIRHRLNLYLPFLKKECKVDPVLDVNIQDIMNDISTMKEVDDLSSTSTSIAQRKRGTTFSFEQTPMSAITLDSRASNRKSKRFWGEDSRVNFDASTLTEEGDDSTVSSRPTTASVTGGGADQLVSKRLVLHRSSNVVGVSLNISHAEPGAGWTERRRLSDIGIPTEIQSTLDSSTRSITGSEHQLFDSKQTEQTVTNVHQQSSHSLESVVMSSSSGMLTNDLDLSRRDVADESISMVDPADNSTAHSISESQTGLNDDETVGSNEKHRKSPTIDGRLCTQVIFEYNRLSDIMSFVNVWTLSDLAAATGESIESLGKKYADTVEKDLCVSDFSIMYKNATKNVTGDKSSTKRRRNTISTRFVGSKQSTSQFKHWLDNSPAHQKCGANILDYLKIVISGLEVAENELISIKSQCYEELKDWDNRASLLSILKQSYNSDKSTASDYGGSSEYRPISNDEEFPSFFPLNSQAFGSMMILFQDILGLCSQAQDYINAYDLLMAGGLFFNIGDRDEGNGGEDDDGYVEFLNSSIKHHPIYQKPELWIAVLKSRLSSEKSHDDDNESGDHLNPDQVILETHGILYMMHSLGVNPERTMLFIQNVVELYQLELNYFMDLKLFLDRLWPVNRRISLVSRNNPGITSLRDDDDSEYSDHTIYESYRHAKARDMEFTEVNASAGVMKLQADEAESVNEVSPVKQEDKRSWFRWGSKK